MMRARTVRDITILVIVALLALLVCFRGELQVTNGRFGAPLDDTYIHMRFAENILAGQGFSYNPGEPTPGSTSPLWVYLIVLGGLVTGNLLHVAIFWSCFFYALMGLAAYALGRRTLASPRWALAFALIVLFTGRQLFAGLSGMEPTLFAALSLIAVERHARDLQDNRPRLFTSILFGLASLARPEGYLLFILYVIDASLRLAPRLKVSLAKIPWPGMIVYLLIISPYMIFSYIHTGHFLGNTFRATRLGLSWYLSGQYIGQVLKFIWYDNFLVYLFLPVGLIWLGVRLVRYGSAGLRAGRSLVLYWPPIYFAVSAVISPKVIHFQRYIIPVLPFAMLICIYGLELTVEWLLGKWKSLFLKVLPEAALLLMIGCGVVLSMLYAPGMIGHAVKNVNEMQVEIGEWVKRATSPDDLIATNDVGAIVYLSRRRVFDVVGLVSPEILEKIEGRGISPDRDNLVYGFLKEKRPGYLIIFPTWYPTLPEHTENFTPVYQVALPDNVIEGGDVMVVYKCTWK